MFSEFNFELLDDPGFKEDSVREELIAPLLRALGYNANGPAKIVRSKALTHPFVFIGSKRYGVNIIPDYLLHASENHRWILDAKSPSENILKGRNPEQAFSYAIHPEVRASRYALCNGRQLSIFDVSRIEPLLAINLKDLSTRFNEVERLLSPIAFTKPHLFNFKPDMGLYLWKLGYRSDQTLSFIPMGLPFVGKIEDGLYGAGVNIQWGEEWLAAIFDFDEQRLEQLLASVNPTQAVKLRDGLKRQPYKLEFTSDIPVICMDIRLGETVISNDNEEYCPFVVDRFYGL